MSDAELRRLERGWNAGEAEAGARLVVERLRRGLALPAPDREAWGALWDHVALEGADPAWRGATLIAGCGGETSRAWTWLARLDDGRWLYATGWHECASGWDCLARGLVRATALDELPILLTSDDVLGLLGAPRPVEGDLLRSLELAWGVGDREAGARLVVERLRRRKRLSPPDHEAWRAMWEHADMGRADRSWAIATLVAGCGSEATRCWTWLARLGHGRWLHVTGEHWCTHCGAGWFCSSEGSAQLTRLAELGGRLTADETRGLLPPS